MDAFDEKKKENEIFNKQKAEIKQEKVIQFQEQYIFK
jgi:hypothetical protein